MKKFLLLMLIFCTVHIAYADTVIPNTLINKPTTWTKIRSPYVIEGRVNIGTLGSLTVEAGTTIRFKNGSIFSQGGKATFAGTADQEIIIDVVNNSSSPLIQGMKAEMRFDHISFIGNNRPFVHAWGRSRIFIDHLTYIATAEMTGVWLNVFGSSTGNISNSVVSGWKGTGIEVFDQSQLILIDSDIQNMKKGINIFLNSSSTMSGNLFSSNTVSIQTQTPNIFISKNDFENNQIHINNIGSLVFAQGNWWGSAVAPKVFLDTSNIPSTDVGVLIGDINYHPISLMRHRGIGTCCSSILFFPGLMGSRLYVKSGGLENQLWEPNRNADVKKLYLNATGESVLSGIYTKDIINRTNIAFGTPYIDQSPYKGFSAFMDKLVKDKVIATWKAVPYDWRFAPDTLLEMNDTELENTIISLSQKSKTKKVTLLSHSNGGFVIKQLMLRLKSVGMEHFIDKIIFVAFPEYGTAQAITSLLFGHEQSIANGLILKTSIAKELGKNMPTAYTLLPSNSFFGKGEVIQLLSDVIASGSVLQTFLNTYSHVNSSLLQKSILLHEQLDSWISPVPIYQLVGTGLPTVSGIQKLDGADFIPTYTNTGDSIVSDMFDVTSHSFARSGTTLAIDLTREKDVKHLTIMNSVLVQKQLSSIIKQDTFDPLVSAGDAVDIRRMPFSYSLAKVSGTSSRSNLILKNSSTTELYDIYKTSPLLSFDYATELTNMDRYELMDQSVLYLNMDSLEKLTMSQQSSVQLSDGYDIDLIEKEGDRLVQVRFEDVPMNPTFTLLVQGAGLSVRISNDTAIHIEPSKETVLDSNGTVLSQKTTTTTRDLQKEAAEVRTQMIRNITSDTLRQRYLVRLNAYAATGDTHYLKDVRTRIQRSIASIEHFDSTPSLKGRYAKLKVDYQFLAYLFYYISPDRPAHMRFVNL